MIWLAIPALAAAAYYLLAIVAAARWRPRARAGATAPAPPRLHSEAGARPRSALLRGHPLARRAGLSRIRDSLRHDRLRTTRRLRDIERLRREFPGLRIDDRTWSPPTRPTPRSGCWPNWRGARGYDVLLVNDSDIVVEPGYLRAVTAPLARSGRRPGDVPLPGAGRILGVALRSAGHRHRVRAQRAGGAPAWRGGVRPRVDHGVPRRSAAAHRRLRGHRQIPGRRLPAGTPHPRAWATASNSRPWWWRRTWAAASWAHTWRHQLRWSRTIRVSRPAGYYGYVVTHATLWALVAFAARRVVGRRGGAGRAHDRGRAGGRRDPAATATVLRDFWLIPLRDLFGFAVWAAGVFGDSVQWRDRRLKLRPDGRIVDEVQPDQVHPIDDGAARG